VVALSHDGKEAWRTDLGPFQSGHGFGASPIVHGNLLTVPKDQDGKSALFALDVATGKTRWQIPRRSKATYTTPCVYRPRNGRPELIFTSYEHGITGVDPETGRVRWEADVFSKGHIETSIGSPVVAGDLVLGTSGWLGVRVEVVAVRLPARGGKAQEVFRIHRSAPLCTTPLVSGTLLFLWSDHGIVTCADSRTGEIHWRKRVPGSYYGSPVSAGGRLYCASREGEVIVLAASSRFELLARNPLGESSHATPAIAGGTMYLRTYTHLISVGGEARK
jgi:outer membrane protein assembly factor BamB